MRIENNDWRAEVGAPPWEIAAVAFLFAGLAPALVMAALWLTTEIALTVFVFTFAIALGHAILFGLPLFLIFRSKGWINVMSCVVVGFTVGATPAGVLTWPTQHPAFHMFYGSGAAAGWVSYLKPLICFGSFGALGGFAFWFVLRWFGGGGAAQPLMPANARLRVRATGGMVVLTRRVGATRQYASSGEG